jgi:hypothetical protein
MALFVVRQGVFEDGGISKYKMFSERMKVSKPSVKSKEQRRIQPSKVFLLPFYARFKQ